MSHQYGMRWWIFENAMQFDIIDVTTQEDNVRVDNDIRQMR